MVFRKVNWKEFIIKWMASEMERSSVTIRIQIREIEKMVTLLIKNDSVRFCVSWTTYVNISGRNHGFSDVPAG